MYQNNHDEEDCNNQFGCSVLSALKLPWIYFYGLRCIYKYKPYIQSQLGGLSNVTLKN